MQMIDEHRTTKLSFSFVPCAIAIMNWRLINKSSAQDVWHDHLAREALDMEPFYRRS
jgi:hypothetical protein